MASEFNVGGHKYRCGNLDAMTQFHVMRRLTPVLASLQEIAKSDQGAGLAGGLWNLPMEALQPVAVAIAKIPDEDIDYILGKTLSVVHRQIDGEKGWSEIWSKSANAPRFNDISMPYMLQIAALVIQDALAPFFAGPPST